MFVTVYQTKGYPIPENMNLDQHCFQNLKMHTDFVASIIIPVFLTPPPPIISILWHPSSYKNRNVETMRNKHNYCTPNLNLWNQNTNEGSLKICWALGFREPCCLHHQGRKVMTNWKQQPPTKCWYLSTQPTLQLTCWHTCVVLRRSKVKISAPRMAHLNVFLVVFLHPFRQIPLLYSASN